MPARFRCAAAMLLVIICRSQRTKQESATCIDVRQEDGMGGLCAACAARGGAGSKRVSVGHEGRLGQRNTPGLRLFRAKARCLSCHSGALLTDQQLHNLG